MPPLSQLRSQPLQSLYEQLRFAPKAALIRDIERAEQLAGEIDADQPYPEDWIVFRITGYRPELDQPAILSGADLLWDLSALVERLSSDAKVTKEELAAESFVDPAVLCERWGVSRKTIDRFRKHGLIARRARASEGQSVLLFSPASVEHFEKSAESPIKRAAGFSRISDADAERMHHRARRYRVSLGYSLNEAALRIAQRFGRSHEGVRQVLLRMDALSDSPVFGLRPLGMDRRKALVLRASRLGIEPAEIAKRLGRSRESVSRTLIEARADALKGHQFIDPIDDESVAPAIDETPDAGSSSQGNVHHHDADLAALIAFARALSPPRAADETRLALNRMADERRASRIVQSLASANVSASDIDQAETMLRREARSREQLVRMQLAGVVRAIEDSLATPIEHVNARELTQLIAMAIGAAAVAVGRFDPSKGSRLAAPVGLAVSRAVTAWDRSGARTSYAGRATPMLLEGIAIPDWTQSVSPWQSYLEPDVRVRRYYSGLPEPMNQVLALRFGLGQVPRSSAETATILGLALPRVGPTQRRGIRACLEASRGAPVA